MKINYMKLKNIGPYVGDNYFDLDTNSSKNINLIGGKNGAGKTTFLKAIKYGMFGSFSLGFKNDTITYLNEIKTLLNNRSKKDFYIEIGFEYVENFDTHNYVIKRSWKKTDDDLIENVKIYKNNYELDEYEAKEINDKIRAITSPQLINSFIFDGEKIGNIIETEKTAEYIEEVFNSIFSIDLIRQTRNDLSSYLSKKADETQNKRVIENVSYINKINLLKNNIASVEKNITETSKIVMDLKQQKKSNMDSFYKLGGLTKAEQEKYNKRIAQYSLDREKISKLIKNYVESDLPIFMNKKLLEEAHAQAQIENQKKYIYYVEEIEKFLNKGLDDLKENIKSNMDYDCNQILYLSDVEFKQLESRLISIGVSALDIMPLLNDRHTKFDEYKLLKKGLEKNQNISEFDILIEKNRKIDESIALLGKEISDSEIKLKEMKTELDLNLEMYNRSNDLIKKESLYDSSFVLGKRAYDLCELFEKRLRKYKLSQVSKKALEIFCDTIRKNDFITEIKIKDDYSLELINSDNVAINPKSLSAGEMQIMISSIIWAMFRISGRREMFIFDTPLARLDVENRQNFISKIISTISPQVVILSTDSEFVGENYNLISDKIYKRYLLNFDEKSYKTNVTEDYFGGN